VDNYLGPHDGRNVSRRALNARFTAQVQPYLENPAVACYRETNDSGKSLALFAISAKARTTAEWRLDDTKRYLSLGREAWHRGRYREAVAFWEMLADVPELRTSEVLGWLGWGLMCRKRTAESLPLFEEALHLDVSNAWARSGLGRALFVLGRAKEALDCFNFVLGKVPNDLLSYCISAEDRGELFFRSGSYEASRADFLILCKLYEQYDKGKCDMAYFRLGLCELRLGRDAAASEAFMHVGGNPSSSPRLTAYLLAIRFGLRRCRGRLACLLRQVKRAGLSYRLA
jgi:tetratricopeptide (TPR) repeat protein